MNRLNWVSNILGFIILIIVLILLAAPYFLVIYFPISGSYIADISKFFIPWSIILLLVLVFNEQIKLVLINIGDLIRRINKGGVGPLSWDAGQEGRGLPLPSELLATLGKMEQEKNDMFKALKYYYFRTLYLTIFRSQAELLQYLMTTKDPVEQKVLKVFHEVAVSRNAALRQYPFERYLGYLKDNFLVEINSGGKVLITRAGRDFIDDLTKNNIPIESFPN